MGENCGYFASSRAGSKSDTVWAENVCDLWYSEIKSYSFSKNDYQPQTGHFTQVSEMLVFPNYELCSTKSTNRTELDV